MHVQFQDTEEAIEKLKDAVRSRDIVLNLVLKEVEIAKESIWTGLTPDDVSTQLSLLMKHFRGRYDVGDVIKEIKIYPDGTEQPEEGKVI